VLSSAYEVDEQLNKTIYKYRLQMATRYEHRLELPFNSKILDVQIQGNQLCLWAIVDPELDSVIRRFRVFGTGWSWKDKPDHDPIVGLDYTHLATVQEKNGMVWHVFEVRG
jgi:hypothetical protein